jgi:hypothetical protein
MNTEDLFEMNDAEFERAGYAYHQAVAAVENAEVVDPLESLSDEELLKRWQQAAQKELRKRHEESSYEAARQFVAEEGRYVESDKNAQRMSQYLEAAIGKDATPSVDDLHSAFAALNRRKLLEVRELPREPRPVLTDDDLYTMPLEDLVDLANHPGAVRRA